MVNGNGNGKKKNGFFSKLGRRIVAERAESKRVRERIRSARASERVKQAERVARETEKLRADRRIEALRKPARLGRTFLIAEKKSKAALRGGRRRAKVARKGLKRFIGINGKKKRRKTRRVSNGGGGFGLAFVDFGV